MASACATRKVLLEQLGRVLPSDVDTLPDKVFLANTADHYGARMAEKLSDNGGFKVLQLFHQPQPVSNTWAVKRIMVVRGNSSHDHVKIYFSFPC